MKNFIVFIIVLFSALVYSQEKWSLQKCIDYAVDNNINIVNSKINETITQTQYDISKSQQLPTVNGNFNNGLNFGFQRTITGIYEYNQSYNNNIGIDASVIIYNRRKLRHQIEQSDINSQIQSLNTESLIQDISLQIASLYLQIILNRELEQIAREQSTNTYDQLDKTQKLYSAGSIPYSTLVEQEAVYANDLNQLENARINVERALFDLAITLQLDDYEEFDIENVLLPEEVAMVDLAVRDVIEAAIENRPEVKLAELQVDAAQKDIEIAQTASWPRLTGGYSLGTAYYDFFNRNDDKFFRQWYDNHNQQLYLQLNIPIFNKINKLNVQQAIQNKDLISQNIYQQELQLTQDIQSAYFDANAAFQQFANAKTAYETAKTSEDYGKMSYDAGKISIYDYNILRTNSIVAESQMVNAKYDYFFRLKVIDFYAGRPITLNGETL